MDEFESLSHSTCKVSIKLQADAFLYTRQVERRLPRRAALGSFRQSALGVASCPKLPLIGSRIRT